MFDRLGWLKLSAACLVLCLVGVATADVIQAATHPPMRTLPKASNRPLAAGPTYFVAPQGNDQHDGSREQPWRTLNVAVEKLKPGDTLCLRGGTYYEAVTVTSAGTAEQPITLRSYPGELAVLDAGLREFAEDPAGAWEPAPGGAADEFRSRKTYLMGGGFGNFADSMVPLHRYIDFYDLRSTNEFYRQSSNNRQTDLVGIYTGPGVRRDPETGRIHVRLAHMQLAGLGNDAYRGETDPRKVPLVVAGHDYALTIEGAKHVRFQDLVVRGASRSAVYVTRHGEDVAQDAENIVFDGCTFYGSGSALRVNHARGFRLTHCAVRGHSAPWLSRFTNKNRAYAGYLVMLEGRDFELDHSEFTDHHDFLQYQRVEELQFHHNRVDNFDDDGFEPGPKQANGRAFIYQNLVSRILNPFTAHADKPNSVVAEPGSGQYVFRNVFDFRRGTYKTPPSETDTTGEYLNQPTVLINHNHGSPTCAVFYVYQNTFLLPAAAFRGYGYLSWASHARGTTRRVFNNLFVQLTGPPGVNYSSLTADDDFAADGNLLWSIADGPSTPGDIFAKFRSSPLYLSSQKQSAPGWGAHDLFADPKFLALTADPKQPIDLRLQPASPAINAGTVIPTSWPDPLRESDPGLPDIGALPLDAKELDAGLMP